MSKSAIVGQKPSELAHVLGLVIKARRMTEAKAADEMGVSVAAVNSWLNKRTEPNQFSCRRIRGFCQGSLRNPQIAEAVNKPTRAPKYLGKKFVIAGSNTTGVWPVHNIEVVACSEEMADGLVSVQVIGQTAKRAICKSRLMKVGPAPDASVLSREEQAANEIADLRAAMAEQGRQNNELRAQNQEMRRVMALHRIGLDLMMTGIDEVTA